MARNLISNPLRRPAGVAEVQMDASRHAASHVVQGQQVDLFAGFSLTQFRELDMSEIAALFLALLAPGVVDQNSPHGLRRGGNRGCPNCVLSQRPPSGYTPRGPAPSPAAFARASVLCVAIALNASH